MIRLIDILAEGTFESREHIAIYSGPDGTANVYKLVDGTYYAEVEGDPSYDMVAKDATDMAIKLKRDGLTTRVTGELSESKNPHLYQIKGILTTNTEKRTQGDILSDMRSIPGVTIVTPKDYHGGDTPIDNRAYTVELSVKIDPHPFKTFGKTEIKGIIDQIKRVDGVISYKPSKIVKRIS